MKHNQEPVVFRVVFAFLDGDVQPYYAPNFQMLVEGSACVCLLIEAHKPRIVSTGFDGYPTVLYCPEETGPRIEARFETLPGWSVFAASASKDGVSICLLPSD